MTLPDVLINLLDYTQIAHHCWQIIVHVNKDMPLNCGDRQSTVNFLNSNSSKFFNNEYGIFVKDNLKEPTNV